MTLPSGTRGRWPPPSKLSIDAHAAVRSDTSIKPGVRLASVKILENAPEPEIKFKEIADGELFQGPVPLINVSTARFGRAILVSSFVKMLVMGWACGRLFEYDEARKIVDELRLAANRGDPATALRKFAIALRPDRGTGVSYLVCWYYTADAPTDSPLGVADPDLALRLALPCARERNDRGSPWAEYLVMEFRSSTVSNPKCPRFVDSDLAYLGLWRGGGRTAPWISGLSGLPEAVALPTILSETAYDYRFCHCE